MHTPKSAVKFCSHSFVFITVAALLLPGRLSRAADAALASPPGAQVVSLTVRPGSFTEPSIAINPNDLQQVVAAFQVKASAAYSRDAGRTWTVADGTAPTDYKVSGDVSITFDNQGRAFLCYIAFDKLGTENYWAHGATRNGIFVRRSLDGGQTWEKDVSTVIAHNSDPGIPFEDKPYIVADTTHSKFAGNLYVGWTQFTLEKSVLLFSRSTDSGKTWSQPVEISSQEGIPRDDNGAVEGFTGAVGADGALYVAWSDASGIVLAVSKDGGRKFSRSRTAIKTGASYFDPSYVFRGNGFPQIAINPRSNELFVTWADCRNGDIDIFSSSSKDRGKHWSPAVRVNSDPIHNGEDQFFQWLAVDPVDGAVNVIFCDRRLDSENRRYSIVLARSTDAGRTYSNYLWSTKVSDPKDAFIGDYLGIAARGGRVYGIWARVAQAEEIPQEKKPEPPSQPPAPSTPESKPAEPPQQSGSMEEEPKAANKSEPEKSQQQDQKHGKPNEETQGSEKEKVEDRVHAKVLFIEVGLADFTSTAH